MGYNLEMSPWVHPMSRGGQTGPGRGRGIPPRPGRHALVALVLSSLIALLSAGASYAQPQIDTRVAFEIGRTDRIIARAAEQLGIAVSNRSGSVLDQAIRIQANAKAALVDHNLKVAMMLTMEARDLARRALESAEIDVKAHESIRDLIESTKDQIDRASPIVTDQGDLQARRLLASGESQLQLADDAYRDQDYRKAIRLAVSARDLVQRAMDRASGGSRPATGAGVDSAIDRTDSLIEELRNGMQENDNAGARTLLDEAVTLQAKAKKLQLTQHPALAFRMTTQARQAALDGLLLLARNPSVSDVGRALAAVEQLANDLAPEILSSQSEDAQVLLDSARQQQAEAKEKLAKGDAAQAMESARIAEGLLRRAAEAAGIR